MRRSHRGFAALPIAAALLLAALTAAFTPRSAAKEPASVEAVCSVYGGRLCVTVSLLGCAGLRDMAMNVYYDNSVLSLKSCRATPEAVAAGESEAALSYIANTREPGAVYTALVFLRELDDVSLGFEGEERFPLFVFTFDILADAEETALDFIVVSAGGAVPEGTSVTVLPDEETEPAAFDLDLDGETTAFDARLALRLAIGLEDDSTVPDPFPADADGDGEV
ncbi:MAG: hypothetical protein K6C36_03490, partial [Clostridia bacterium]|nr:hypothetical protein [Clostridia bacterium]